MKNDFSEGSVKGHIMKLALPMTLAQLIHVLYNVIDRIYIGKIPNEATLSLTGIGVTLPIITLVMAFANLIGMGGAPLFSIARGKDQEEQACYIMGNSFILLCILGACLTVGGWLIKRPLLYALGASDVTFAYADAYMSFYLIGNIFVMINLGMNNFINAQGFGKIGMYTIGIGAVANMILDPVFIFGLGMGIKGAALATVLSQLLSTLWILMFLTSKQAAIRLETKYFKLRWSDVKAIVILGMSGFIMSVTNSGVQMACNVSLKAHGGDLYVGVMAIIDTIRTFTMLPLQGITNGTQPIIGYNYGAKLYSRVKQAIKFMVLACMGYALILWAIIGCFPTYFIKLFTQDTELIQLARTALTIYFSGFFMMALQHSAQAVFVGLGKSRQAIFFSILRKGIIVIPLTLYLPRWFGLGVNGVFIAEPISNVIGGMACFTTMWLILHKELKIKGI